MATQTFNLSLPEELVKELDAQAKRDYSSRSEYIRRAIVSQLRSEQALKAVFERAHKKTKKLGITSEQQVYDILDQ